MSNTKSAFYRIHTLKKVRWATFYTFTKKKIKIIIIIKYIVISHIYFTFLLFTIYIYIYTIYPYFGIANVVIVLNLLVMESI